MNKSHRIRKEKSSGAETYLKAVRTSDQMYNSSSSLRNLGQKYLLAGKFREAEEILKTALKKNPEDITGKTLLGLTYYRSGQLTKALEIFERLSKTPDVLYY